MSAFPRQSEPEFAQAGARGYPDAVTNGERYGWVAGVADDSTEDPAYHVQFLGDPAPVTVGGQMLRSIEPPDIALGSWRPSLPMAAYLLATYQVDRELLTERELGSPSLPQERDRQRLLRDLTTWGRLDEDRLLAGLRPLMDQIRAGREAELDEAFRQINLVATEFPARAPTTGAPAPAPGRRPQDHGDPRRPRPTP